MSENVPFLTDDEIMSIVCPLKQPAAIFRWFRQHGFPDVQRRPNGMPLVSRSYFDTVTNTRSEKPDSSIRTVTKPNVQAFMDRLKHKKAA